MCRALARAIDQSLVGGVDETEILAIDPVEASRFLDFGYRMESAGPHPSPCAMICRMGSSRPNPAYRILSERLLIRCWSPADAGALRESLDASDAHLRPWIPFMKEEPRSLEETVRVLRENRAMFDSDENYRYGVFSPDEKTLFGEVMLLNRVGPGAREIGYWMDLRQSGKGHASEAVAAMVQVAFVLDRVERLEIHCSPENLASVKVAEKLGFVHEATLKARFRNPAGELGDTVIWTMFADGYAGSVASKLELECFDAAGQPLVP